MLIANRKYSMEINCQETEFGILYSITGALSGTQKSTITVFEKLSAAIDKGTKGIVVDLKMTTFVDSMSIGLLVGVLLKAKEKNIPLRFQNIPEHIGRVFESTQLKKIFPELY
jgi:anti-anti-sigma factor